MATTPLAFPLNTERLAPHLTAYGFTRHLIDDYPGSVGRGPAIVHLAHPGHSVVVLTGGPVERVHAQVFDVTFGSNTPPAVIHAAAVAALTIRSRPTTCR